MSRWKIEYSLFGESATHVLWTDGSAAKARQCACTRIASERGLTSYAVRRYFDKVPLALKVTQANRVIEKEEEL